MTDVKSTSWIVLLWLNIIGGLFFLPSMTWLGAMNMANSVVIAVVLLRPEKR